MKGIKLKMVEIMGVTKLFKRFNIFWLVTSYNLISLMRCNRLVFTSF